MSDRAAQELEAVKRLLVLFLMKLGTSPDEIGLALNLTGRRVRQLMPPAEIAKFKRLKDE